MKTYIGYVEYVDKVTYDIHVRIPELDDAPVAVTPLSSTVSDSIYGGSNTLPYKNSKCLVVKNGIDFYLMGYFNEPTGASRAGFIADPSNIPQPKADIGDTIQKHRMGNYTQLGRGWWGTYCGIGAYYKLIGNEENTSHLFTHHIINEMPAGYSKWMMLDETIEDVPASFEWLIKKNYENDDEVRKADYFKLNVGTLGEEEESSIFNMNLAQYGGGIDKITDIFISLSKDDENRLFHGRFDDFLENCNTEIELFNAYNLVLSSVDGKNKRSYIIDLFSDEGYKKESYIEDSGDARQYTHDIAIGNNLKYENFNEKRVETLENSGKSTFFQEGDANFEFKGKYFAIVDGKLSFVCSDINLAEETGAEPSVLGDTLKSILEELMQVFNSHIHPTGTGPSGTPLPKWQPSLPPMLSKKVRLS